MCSSLGCFHLAYPLTFEIIFKTYIFPGAVISIEFCYQDFFFSSQAPAFTFSLWGQLFQNQEETPGQRWGWSSQGRGRGERVGRRLGGGSNGFLSSAEFLCHRIIDSGLEDALNFIQINSVSNLRISAVMVNSLSWTKCLDPRLSLFAASHSGLTHSEKCGRALWVLARDAGHMRVTLELNGNGLILFHHCWCREDVASVWEEESKASAIAKCKMWVINLCQAWERETGCMQNNQGVSVVDLFFLNKELNFFREAWGLLQQSFLYQCFPSHCRTIFQAQGTLSPESNEMSPSFHQFLLFQLKK